jgi:hypothetical protein
MLTYIQYIYRCWVPAQHGHAAMQKQDQRPRPRICIMRLESILAANNVTRPIFFQWHMLVCRARQAKSMASVTELAKATKQPHYGLTMREGLPRHLLGV